MSRLGSLVKGLRFSYGWSEGEFKDEAGFNSLQEISITISSYSNY